MGLLDPGSSRFHRITSKCHPSRNGGIWVVTWAPKGSILQPHTPHLLNKTTVWPLGCLGPDLTASICLQTRRIWLCVWISGKVYTKAPSRNGGIWVVIWAPKGSILQPRTPLLLNKTTVWPLGCLGPDLASPIEVGCPRKPWNIQVVRYRKRNGPNALKCSERPRNAAAHTPATLRDSTVSTPVLRARPAAPAGVQKWSR